MQAFTAHWMRGQVMAIALAAGWVLSIAACSPALDWREARLGGPGLLALFPCRPVAQSRQIELAGAQVTMDLHACEAAGVTYAVGVADVRDPAHVGSALQALYEASAAKIGNATPAASTAWSVEGMTPQAAAGRWRLGGQRPDGSPLAMETAVFARGTWVLQASVVGAAPPPVAVTPFFEGLHFPP
jgi:hypothetical protein